MAAIQLTLYQRPGCHLCEEMQSVIEPVARDVGCTVAAVDISGDAALEASLGEEIPVLMINGRKAFKYRLTERELRQRLRRERA